jgi:DNA-binding CsgD family transcriptional regulator
LAVTARVDIHARVSDLLAAARGGRGGALFVSGDAGVGKSTLLDEVGRAAEGFRVVRIGGSEAESAIDHLGLHQMAVQLRGHTAEIPVRQRVVLESALGWGPVDRAADRHLVGPATLSLLAAAADTKPVLVLVDDLHWLDPSSTAALLFAARRLESDPVLALFASRSGVGLAAGLDTVTLEGLTERELIDVLPTGVAPHVADRLMSVTGGNPLALAETVERLTPAQLRGAAALPDPLPIGGRVEALYRPLLDQVSEPARYAALLLAASRGLSSAPIVAALADRHGNADEALGEIEDRGLIVRSATELRFRHPLVRSAVWATARPSERRAVHAALAEVTPGDRPRDRAWHLAEAATEPDDEIAAELEQLAFADRERSGYATASASLERAANLTTDQRAGADRMAAAIENAALAGDIDRARRLAQALLDGDPGRTARGRATAVLGTIEHTTGSVARASQLLQRAAEHTEGVARVRVLAELAMAYHRLGDYLELFATGQRLVAVADHSDPEQHFLSSCFEGLIALVTGDHGRARTNLDEAFDTYHTHPALRDDPRHLPLATLMAAIIDLTPERARFLEARLDHVRAVGAMAVLVPVLALFSYGRAFLLGDHRGAYADAGEAADLGRALGIVADTAPAVEALAWQCAARGKHDQAESLLAEAAALVDQAGTSTVAAHLALTRAFCALCRADHGEIITILELRLEVDEGRGAMGEPLGVAPMLVEAYIAVGRTDEARTLADRFTAVAAPDPATTALLARSRALTTTDDDPAVEQYERALAAHAAAPDVFERARTELLYGSFLRRIGRRTEARIHLRRAHDRFESMDHTAWAQRCISELAASGESTRRRRSSGHEALTPQETRVALLVGEGLTNRDVAAALFISPKTVETHLASIYRKRNLRSRTELARALATDPATHWAVTDSA